MNKNSVSSLELAALVNELQFLVKGKVSQIYHQEKKELLLQLHAPGKGKQLLKIIPGKFLCLTSSKKESPLHPTGFSMQLRKYLNNAFIKKVYQRDSERIVVFEFDRHGQFYLIIELFSKGNIVLCDDKYKILGTLEWQKWKDRVVKPGEKYIFPAVGVNWKTLNVKELGDILKKSDKKNLATSLATEIGFGGLYAEEICKLGGVDKDQLPGEADASEVKLIIKALEKILKLIESPSGYIYEEQITPFALIDMEEEKKLETYHEAVNTINPFQKVSPYLQKIKKIETMISRQEKAIASQEAKIELNKRKGELIYEKYAPLQKLLNIVDDLKKENDWDVVAKELKKEKKIKSVDLKKKKIIIDI